MNLLVLLFPIIAVLGLFTAHYGAAILALLFAGLTYWAREQFELQDYIHRGDFTPPLGNDLSDKWPQTDVPVDLDKHECESAKSKL